MQDERRRANRYDSRLGSRRRASGGKPQDGSCSMSTPSQAVRSVDVSPCTGTPMRPGYSFQQQHWSSRALRGPGTWPRLRMHIAYITDQLLPQTATDTEQMVSMLSALGRALGMQDVEVGDGEFDEQFVVKSQPEQFAHTVLAAD